MTTENARLDLLSISQTNPPAFVRCIYGAPLVALLFHNRATIQQTCCNHWDCPACGQIRAREEYHRIVWGAQVLSDEGHELYFWTLTCKGKELSYETAMDGYYNWTNILLTNARAKAKRASAFWAYIQVTEHQKKNRRHPHSHLLVTFLPPDSVSFQDRAGDGALASAWFFNANISAGLGVQHRMSQVQNTDAVSRYIAKYLFKSALSEQWPPHWRRVRYSRNWPMPPHIKAEIAIPLLTSADWERAANEKVEWICENYELYDLAKHHLANLTVRLCDVDF